MTHLTTDDKLIVLIEECGEVIQAATKCLRFGWDRDQPGYGVNHEVLAAEIGDLLGVISSLDLNSKLMIAAADTKMAKVKLNKVRYGI
jgi:NTP pyrophosphatase (non-canonical NTP hydrolase)